MPAGRVLETPGVDAVCCGVLLPFCWVSFKFFGISYWSVDKANQFNCIRFV